MHRGGSATCCSRPHPFFSDHHPPVGVSAGAHLMGSRVAFVEKLKSFAHILIVFVSFCC